MNIQKMNDMMMELEERENAVLLEHRITNEYDYQRGVTDGFLKCMRLLGYEWKGIDKGGFRRDRQA